MTLSSFSRVRVEEQTFFWTFSLARMRIRRPNLDHVSNYAIFGVEAQVGQDSILHNGCPTTCSFPL